MGGSPGNRKLANFGCSLGFLGTLWVERYNFFDSLAQVRNSDAEAIGDEDALQDSESSWGDRKHQGERARTLEVFVVERIPHGCQMPGVVTSDHVDKDDTKSPDVGVERGVRNKLPILVEALCEWSE